MGIIKDPTSWRAGFELGLAGFSFPYSKPRKPTAYLYNGIRLPALPEWDRGVYPYANIYESDSFGYCVAVISAPYTAVGDSLYILPVEEYPTYSQVVYYLNNGAWTVMRFGNGTTNNGLEGNIISSLSNKVWTNYNILNHEDGSVAFATSDPVPVYD